ncbi:MAG: 5-formyltetrahydrofolate cyclo-ligase [Planctomycetes bacterium RBG_13_46_10]|nr:MAG: 5-formyltetrahydrofolate cyclo-ligase [Planctomycetes bacterium RBG_13_46_10]
MDKKQLRRQIQNNLLEMSEELRAEKSRKACQNLVSMKEFQDASTVMMYLSLPHEVDTAEAILHAWQLGKTVAVPKISWQQRHMIPVQINSLETGFSTEVSGLRNPVTGVPVPFEEIDLIVAPALGFDRKGHRLGRGGSYYDRLFSNKQLQAFRCGFAFQEQVMDSIPVTECDEPVYCLVTDEEILYFNSHKKGD